MKKTLYNLFKLRQSFSKSKREKAFQIKNVKNVEKKR